MLLKGAVNRKWLEKCSIGKRQLRQPKPVLVETVDPNRTQPKIRYHMTRTAPRAICIGNHTVSSSIWN